MSRRRRLQLTALAAVVVVAAAIVTAVSAAGGGSATAFGAQYPTTVVPIQARTYVLLPTGRLDITYDREPEDAPEDAKGNDVPAPDDGRFVLLRWAWNVEEQVPLAYTADGPRRPVTITLVTRGRHIPLRVDGARLSEPGVRPAVPIGASYVAVPGDGAHAALEVGYAGVTQRVDLATGRRQTGRAAPLYDAVDPGDRDCGLPRLSAGARLTDFTPTCEFSLERTAYVEGLGWAPAGRAWLLVGVSAFLPRRAVRHGVGYDIDVHGSSEVRYGRTVPTPAGSQGAPAAGDGSFGYGGPRSYGVVQVAARGPLDTIRLVARTRLVRSEESARRGPARLSVTLTWTGTPG